jgi:uncharacterized repeat protein (TIGR03837 family)
MASADRQRDWWRQLGAAPPPAGTLRVSLFAYENPALGELLHLWQASPRPVCCLVPWHGGCRRSKPTPARRSRWATSSAAAALEIRLLPFLEQPPMTELLWLCDLNFVRGEDSFVRAQWAAQPLVWHIYRQPEAAHLIKLDAFLARYCAALPPTDACPLRDFWQGWNAGRVETRAGSGWPPGCRSCTRTRSAGMRNSPARTTSSAGCLRFSRSGL